MFTVNTFFAKTASYPTSHEDTRMSLLLPLLKCGYTEADIATAKPEDMNLYYTPEKQEKYGLLGIEIKAIGV